jgi:hypothetical protein
MFENGAIPIESGGARRQVDLLAIILSLCDMSPTPVVCRSPNAGPTAFGVGCFGVYLLLLCVHCAILDSVRTGCWPTKIRLHLASCRYFALPGASAAWRQHCVAPHHTRFMCGVRTQVVNHLQCALARVQCSDRVAQLRLQRHRACAGGSGSCTRQTTEHAAGVAVRCSKL